MILSFLLFCVPVVVVNMDTQTGPYALVDDTGTALEWVAAHSAESGHWLHGMASDAPRVIYLFGTEGTPSDTGSDSPDTGSKADISVLFTLLPLALLQRRRR